MKKLIILDGTYGVGKTTVAHLICEISDEYKCVDPDEYFNSDPLHYALNGGWPIPQNSIIKNIVRKEVENQIQYKNIIIPLTLNSEKYRKDWTEYFRDIADVKHLILVADINILRKRINDCPERDKGHALENLESNEEYYRKCIEGATKIDTSELVPEEIAKTILESLR